tara:strand:+ start:534 stop:752 length:219 start_codon:yes stop_codon:yes gene_type:complete
MSEHNKSGFEIRAMLLSQAQGILMDNYDRMKDSIYMHNEVFPNERKELPAVEISAQDIIATAKELNSFVVEK